MILYGHYGVPPLPACAGSLPPVAPPHCSHRGRRAVHVGARVRNPHHLGLILVRLRVSIMNRDTYHPTRLPHCYEPVSCSPMAQMPMARSESPASASVVISPRSVWEHSSRYQLRVSMIRSHEPGPLTLRRRGRGEPRFCLRGAVCPNSTCARGSNRT